VGTVECLPPSPPSFCHHIFLSFLFSYVSRISWSIYTFARRPHKIGDQRKMVGADVGPNPATARPPVAAAQDVVDAGTEPQYRHPRPLRVAKS